MIPNRGFERRDSLNRFQRSSSCLTANPSHRTNVASRERNTTLPHEDAQTAPNEELDTNVITDKSHRHHPNIPGHHNKHRQEQHAKQTQVEMYSGLEVQDNSDDGEPKDGAIKKVLNKLSCGTL